MEHQPILSEIPTVDISQKGIFKYILIEAKQQGNQSHKKLFVRGSTKLQYHAQNYDAFAQSLKKSGYKITRKSERLFTAKKDNNTYKFTCLGGGRIQHQHNSHKCFIYGYSQTFGVVDHKFAQQLVSKALGYPLAQIKTSKEGY